MKIAVLFDGAGLARLGLEEAGHQCTGIELCPVKHELGRSVGSGNCLLGDVRDFDISNFDAVWASPPCQQRSVSRTQGAPKHTLYAEDLVDWSLGLPHEVLWVENVVNPAYPNFGRVYNAGQFLAEPIQNRNRIVGGRFKEPAVFHSYRRYYPGICPTITASEERGCASDRRRASRYYGRKLTIEECAYHQGFRIPEEWYVPASWFNGSWVKWRNHIYQAIGNGVPVYMARAFGQAQW